jgi:CubicO group peptidase (beta-lactamase class C family)
VLPLCAISHGTAFASREPMKVFPPTVIDHARFLVPAVLLACADDPAAEHHDVPRRFREFARQFEREREALGIPGAAVAILEDGELAFARGFGTKGIESTESVAASTIFRIGSMGKLMTAIGVMSAVDDGRLDLDAPIRTAIPDLSLMTAESEELTLRRLLSQESGLRDYVELEGSGADEALAEFSSGSELAENVDFMNPPGLFWNYSNPNFFIAGRALEAQTGVPYREAIAERVFAPLRMERSFLLPGDVIADGDYTHGYGVNSITGEGSFEDLAPDAYDNGWARPAGFHFSNVLDWAKVMQFLIEGNREVLSDEAHAEVVTAQVSTGTIYADVKTLAFGLGDDYGLGLAMGQGFFMDYRGEPETYYAVPFLSHGGDVPGFATTFAVLPSTGFAIVVLSNRDAERPDESIRLALESFGGLPEPSTPPPGRGVDPSLFPSYAGTFVSRDGATITLGVEDGQLVIDTNALDELGLTFERVLEPVSLDNFELWITEGGERFPLEITLFPDETGQYVWFRSRIAVAKRASPASAP